jgi:chitinase
MNTFIKYILFAFIALQAVSANDKVVVYWGQDSSGNEESLRTYCTAPSTDIFVIGFVYEFPTAPGSAYPGINFANHCYKTFDNADPLFLNCSDSIAPDITYCQSIGKKILLSFGGAVGTYGFTSDAEAETFATTVWNMFLGGTSTTRPFGSAIIDGVDLDIESGGPTGYAAFITKLRSYFTAQTARTYTISGAPQCVYPDAMLGPGAGTALGEAWFDYVWVQFYNNYCGVNYYPSEFNFNSWATWASSSVNPNVQVFIGAPGSQSAAGQGYVTASTLQIIATAVLATYPSNYGGIMLWDAGSAYNNGDFATQLASFVHVGTSTPVISTPTPPVTPSPAAPVVVAVPSTTGSAHVPLRLTTQSVQKSHTTAKTSTSTSSSAVVTPSTTGRVKTPVPAPVTPTPVAASTSTSSSSNSCSANGHMRCAGASSYQTCTNGLWSVVQSCAANLVCSPSGDYIYCIS